MRLIDLVKPEDLQAPQMKDTLKAIQRAEEMHAMYGNRIREIATAMVDGTDIPPRLAFGIAMTIIDSIDWAIEHKKLN